MRFGLLPFLAIAFCACALAGCSSAAPALTELVLVIRADLPVDQLEVRVTGPEGSTAVREHIVRPSFPIAIVMTRDHEPYAPVTIHVEGGGYAADAVTELVVGQRRRIELSLSSRCECVTCAATETCQDGACTDRRVRAVDLGTWVSGEDAGLPTIRDAGPPRDASLMDAGRPCGCHDDPCCAGDVCNGSLSCRSGSCLDCSESDPTLTGMLPAGALYVTAISASGSSFWVSTSDGTGTAQTTFTFGDGVTASGTAPLSELTAVAASADTMTLSGPAGATGTIRFTGATLSGAFAPAPRTDGMPGTITSVRGADHTIVFTGWDGSTGVVTLTPMESCR